MSIKESRLKKTMPELERMEPSDYANEHKNGLVVVLDNIRSAYNVGSIFRTADCFGISKIYLCGITCQIDNRELQKTALGAQHAVPSEYVKQTITAVDNLKEAGYEIISLEQTKNSVSIQSDFFDSFKNYALVLGNEVEGVDEEVLQMSNLTIEIPQIGSKHSLNVANASTVVFWEYYKQNQD